MYDPAGLFSYFVILGQEESKGRRRREKSTIFSPKNEAV